VTADVFAAVPARQGHFALESGYHTDLWLTLDAMFAEPAKVAPLVNALAAKLRRHDVAGICGPLLGGAFLALAVATRMQVAFYYSEHALPRAPGLFTAEYRLRWELSRRVRGQRIAVVDDVMSAGSSVRATVGGGQGGRSVDRGGGDAHDPRGQGAGALRRRADPR
jgi:orotate phosphoribosyltransferase